MSRKARARPTGPAPAGPALAELVASGSVNAGWTPRAWAARLRQLADRCADVRPDLAAAYRASAGDVLAQVRRAYGCDTSSVEKIHGLSVDKVDRAG